MRLELKSLPCSICTGSFGDGGDHNLLLAIYCVNGELIIIDSGVVTFKSSRISLNLYSPIIWDWISDSFIFHNSDSSLHCISYVL